MFIKMVTQNHTTTMLQATETIYTPIPLAAHRKDKEKRTLLKASHVPK